MPYWNRKLKGIKCLRQVVLRHAVSSSMSEQPSFRYRFFDLIPVVAQVLQATTSLSTLAPRVPLPQHTALVEGHSQFVVHLMCACVHRIL